MTARRFDSGDQDAFARLSGDSNPLHLDPIATRRLIFGGPVVHGIHALLWALDAVADPSGAAIKALDAEFTSPISVGAEVSLDVGTPSTNTHHLMISTQDGVPAAVVDVVWCDSSGGLTPPKSGCPEAGTPCVVSPEDAADLSGRLDLHLDRDLAGSLFPNLAGALDPTQLATFLATSRVVGMECPGAHSIFSSIHLEEAPETANEPVLEYRVRRVRPRLSLVDIEVTGGGLQGQIRALFRPPPTDQPSFTGLAALVGEGEFMGQKALIVGGSRGLGEVAAKILASGGADVRLTYHTGRADAERVRDEITSGGGKAQCLEFNVLSTPQDLGKRLGEGWRPTLLGYFATPHIGVSPSHDFSNAIYQRLSRTYVDGFRATVAAIRTIDTDNFRVLYPSSVYVDDMPANMKEYAQAKETGARACAELATEVGFTFIAPKFPRFATDQTARLLGEKNADAGAAMLGVLRQLCGGGG